MPLRSAALAVLLAAAASAQSPVPPFASPEAIATGFQFTEGPVWFEGALLFSDIPANRVYRWDPADETVEAFLDPSQNSNGLALDAEGRLLLAQHGARRLARLEDGGLEALAEAFDGATFNSPNDLVVHPDGSVYFTDPTWGLEGRTQEIPFTGVYRLAPDGTVTLLVDDVPQPNGIGLSPDLGTLYVNDSALTLMAYDLEDGQVSNGRVFATLVDAPGIGGADGLEVDAAGRLYVAGPRGVWVFAPDGTVLDVVDVPGQTTNVAFGPDDTLYITSGPTVYRLELVAGTTGPTAGEAAPVEAGLEVASVAPNPAADRAAIVVRLEAPYEATLEVIDAAGRTVRTLALGGLPAGEHRVEVGLEGLAAGAYTVRLRAGDASTARPLTVGR